MSPPPGLRLLPRNRHTLAGVAAVLLWSSTVALARSLAEQLGALGAGAAVYTLGGAAACLHLARRRQLRATARALPGRYLAGCGALFVAYMPCLYLALGLAADRRQVLAVGLVNYLWPALTLVFSLFLLGQRARPLLGVGTALALSGVALGVLGDEASSWSSFAEGVGANPIAFGLGLAAAVTWALYSNLARRWQSAAAGASGVPFFLLAAGLLLTALRWALPELTAYAEAPPRWSAPALLELLALTATSTVAYALWDAGVRRGDLAFVAAFSYLAPLLATVAAAAYLRAWPGLTLWLGCGFVVAGSLISWRSVGDGTEAA